MRWLRVILSVLLLLAFTAGLRAEPVSQVTGRVAKVLPLFMDLQGNVAPSPSLYDRDAYQYILQQSRTNAVSGIRFDVCWSAHKASGLNLKIRLELQGIGA